jgi:hypothetical protein
MNAYALRLHIYAYGFADPGNSSPEEKGRFALGPLSGLIYLDISESLTFQIVYFQGPRELSHLLNIFVVESPVAAHLVLASET